MGLVDVSDPKNLTPQEREILRKVWSNPLLIEEEFKSWMHNVLEADPPTFLASQLIGLSREAVKPVATADAAAVVTNTVAETTILSEVIREGSLGENGMIRVTIGGHLLNNSGNPRNHTLRIKFGGTELYDDTTIQFTNNTILRPIELDFKIANIASTSTQFMYGEYWVANDAAAATGLGDLGTPGSGELTVVPFCTNGTFSVDTTQDQTIEVTIQLEVAHASFTYTMQHYLVELIA